MAIKSFVKKNIITYRNILPILYNNSNESYYNKSFKKDLFNDDLLSNQNELAKANIFFARSNINHLEKKYAESNGKT